MVPTRATYETVLLSRDTSHPVQRTAALLFAVLALLAACDPFVARVKGGSESHTDWEIGVKF